MKHQAHSVAVGIMAGVAAFAVPLAAPAQKASAQGQPKTAWGEPDISGVYAEFTTAPLERPAELGDKEFFTPEEHAAYAQKRLEQVNEDDETVPGTPEDVHYDMGTFALSENEGTTSLNLRTSIVTDAEERPNSAAHGGSLCAARRARGSPQRPRVRRPREPLVDRTLHRVAEHARADFAARLQQ